MSDEREPNTASAIMPYKEFNQFKMAPEISHFDILERMVKLEQKFDSYLEFDQKHQDKVTSQIEALTEATMQNTVEIRTIVRLGGALLLVLGVIEGLTQFGGLPL